MNTAQGWLLGGLRLVESWSAEEVLELASALEPMALEDEPSRWEERWREVEANLPRRAHQLRELRLSPPRPVPDPRVLLLLHRAWRQIMLLAPVDLPRVRALARALADGPPFLRLVGYQQVWPDGAHYLGEPLGLTAEQASRWLSHQDHLALD